MNSAIVLASKKLAPLSNYPLLTAPIYQFVVNSLKEVGIEDIHVLKENDQFDLNSVNGDLIIVKGDLPFLGKEAISNILAIQKEVINTTGFISLKKSLLDTLKTHDVYSLIDHINANYPDESRYYSIVPISDFKQLSEVEDKLRYEVNVSHMLNGVYIENPDTVTIGRDVIIEPGASIRANSILSGKSVIKAGCVIGPSSEINNSTVGENTQVIYSMLVDSSIGANGTVGPYTHIRMHSELGDNIRAGNFIEVKNSKVADNTKMSHLSYIGDTDCGSNVNWGCGCVTVNYNGKIKQRTTVGDNAFIGCNTNLIAPVKVESNTFIAAGSTITDDIPFDGFAIARAKQVTKIDYAHKYLKSHHK